MVSLCRGGQFGGQFAPLLLAIAEFAGQAQPDRVHEFTLSLNGVGLGNRDLMVQLPVAQFRLASESEREDYQGGERDEGDHHRDEAGDDSIADGRKGDGDDAEEVQEAEDSGNQNQNDADGQSEQPPLTEQGFRVEECA